MSAQGSYWVVIFDHATRGETLSRHFDTREQAMSHACANLYRPSLESVRALRGPGNVEVSLDEIKRECAKLAQTSP